MEYISQDEFEDFLVRISDCFIERDFATWRARIVTPFSLVTSAGIVTLTNEEELQQNFLLYLKACDCMNLDQVLRVPKSLEDCKDGTWIGTYETHLLSNGTRATNSYTSSVLLMIDEGTMKMRAILNARGTDEWVVPLPS